MRKILPISLSKQTNPLPLKNDNLEAVNSFDTPFEISPTEQPIYIKGNTVALVLAPYSFSVVKVKLL